MEAMLEAGVGRFRGPSLAAMLAEMWAPLAVALAALATLPSLLGRLQVLILRLRSRGKEAISSHISTYYSSGDDDDSDAEDDSEDDESDSDDAAGSSGEDEEVEEPEGRVGYFEGAADGLDGCFPFGGAVVRTWQDLPRRFSFTTSSSAGFQSGDTAPAVRLWAASTASGEGSGPAWWDGADDSGRRHAAEAPVVVGWRRREHAARRRQRLLPVMPSPQ